MFSVRKTVALAALILGSSTVMADEKLDKEMNALALNSGCFICHHIESGAKGPNGMAPIGPNWEDVAVRYKGQKGAADALTKAVMQGSNPYGSHWKDKVSGLAMPPNAVAIKEADAKKLVNWILALKK
jgi:cytochrome c